MGLEGVDEKTRDVAKKAAEEMVKVSNKVEEEKRKKKQAEQEENTYTENWDR